MQKPRADRADDRPLKGPQGRKTNLLRMVVLGGTSPGACKPVEHQWTTENKCGACDARRLLVGDLICERIQMGCTKKAAILSAGVSESHAYQWVARGERDLAAGRATPYSQFAERYARAEGHLEAGAVAEIRAAGRNEQRPDWRAAAWLLEHRLPKIWGARPDVAVTLQAGGERHGSFRAMIEESFRADAAARGHGTNGEALAVIDVEAKGNGEG